MLKREAKKVMQTAAEAVTARGVAPEILRTRGSESTILPRSAPVLWQPLEQAVQAGPWDEVRLRKFEERGFVVVPQVFSDDEVAAMREEVESLRSNSYGHVNVTEDSRIVTEPDSGAIKSQFAFHWDDTRCASIARDNRLRKPAMQILASDVYIHQSRINFQVGFSGKGFRPHSDWETWASEDGMEQPRALSAVVMLDRNSAQNGALMVVPGSHRDFLTCPGETPDENWTSSLREQVVGSPAHELIAEEVRRCNDQLVYVEGSPGDVFFFDCNLLHFSNGNLSPWPRTNLFLVFNSTENKLKDPVHAQAPRPEHIAARRLD